MKASDLIQLLEYGKAFKEPKAKRLTRRKKEVEFDDVSITMMLHRKLEEAAALKTMLEDYHKIHKKEEKKEEKKGLSIMAMSQIMMATFPITGLLAAIFLHMITH